MAPRQPRKKLRENAFLTLSLPSWEIHSPNQQNSDFAVTHLCYPLPDEDDRMRQEFLRICGQSLPASVHHLPWQELRLLLLLVNEVDQEISGVERGVLARGTREVMKQLIILVLQSSNDKVRDAEHLESRRKAVFHEKGEEHGEPIRHFPCERSIVLTLVMSWKEHCYAPRQTTAGISESSLVKKLFLIGSAWVAPSLFL